MPVCFSSTVRRAVRTGAVLAACGAASFSAVAYAQQTPDAALTPAATTNAPQKFTFNSNVPARQLLGAILSQAGVSYIIGPDVTGDLSVSFTDLPLETALARIAQSFSPPLSVTSLKDGSYVIRGGEKGATRLALSTPPTTVTVNQRQPDLPTAPPVSVSVVGGDPVAVALELQIIALRVDREVGAKFSYGPSSSELSSLGYRILSLEKQLSLHKAAATAAKPVKTAQLTKSK